MFIKVNKLSDFKSFIVDLIDNGETNIRVFISSGKKSESVAFLGTKAASEKKYTDFKFVILSPIYHVVYSDKVLNKEYSEKISELESLQNELNNFFQIKEFKNIIVNEDNTHITVEN